jgi:hypothetical protein
MSTTLLVLAGIGNAAAQSKKESNAHIGFMYPISTNGVFAPEYTNHFSLHLVAGVSNAETSFCASGLANVVKEKADGCTMAGFANVITGSSSGAQLAGFLNYIKYEANGLQAAGFLNCTGHASGAQLGGFANLATGDVDGAQLAGFVNVAGNTDVQLAGFANIANNVEATQVGGFVNVAGDVKAQVAGFINVGEDVNTQVAGFINIAKDVKGLQLAGFVNIAERSDYPIGIVNIIKKGEKGLGVTIDEDLTTMLSFRSGGRITYGIVGVGLNFKEDEPFYALEAGLGAHIPIIGQRFRINTEATATSLTDFTHKVTFRSAIALMPSVVIEKNLEIFAGPTFGYTNFDYDIKEGSYNYVWTSDLWDRTHALYIGAKVGVQLHF